MVKSWENIAVKFDWCIFAKHHILNLWRGANLLLHSSVWNQTALTGIKCWNYFIVNILLLLFLTDFKLIEHFDSAQRSTHLLCTAGYLSQLSPVNCLWLWLWDTVSGYSPLFPPPLPEITYTSEDVLDKWEQVTVFLGTTDLQL